MKTLKVGIASYEDMKARTMAIARGELQPQPGDPKVWFTSPESFARLLSNRNRALLAQISQTHPESLHDLAAATGRTPGNLSRTLKTMERYGLVRLHKGARGKVRPEVAYRDVQLEMTLSQGAPADQAPTAETPDSAGPAAARAGRPPNRRRRGRCRCGWGARRRNRA